MFAMAENGSLPRNVCSTAAVHNISPAEFWWEGSHIDSI
jgi:hypothetical protein